MRWTLICVCLLVPGASFGAASTAIADAAMQQDGASVRSLLAQHADVNAPQADGTTALHWAARWNDLDMASALIAAGANPRASNRDGASPLFLACVNGSAPMIASLLQAGADPNAPFLLHGETPLMMAARSGSVAAVQALLDRGARVQTRETLRGTTALMWAAEQGHAPIVRLLLQHGADPTAQSKVLNPIQRRGLGFARGAGPDLPRGPAIGGVTALILAARQGELASVEALLAAGARVDQTSADGSSPLLVAVQNGFYEIARFLLEHGADPNLANRKGWTPLYLAVKNRNQETTAIPAPDTAGVLPFIRALLDRGAHPNLRIQADTEVHQGMTALWLKEAGATPLLRAALSGDLTVVRLLLAHGADPLLPTFDHTTPLMVASGVGWADGMIHEHSEQETLQVIRLLLDAGADVNAANDHGITALHGAAYKGANQAVQLLVDRGARLDVKDKGEDYGFGASTVPMTPLNWAEGVPIGMSSAIYHTATVALLTRLMQQRGIPVVSNTFQGRKPAGYNFGNPAGDPRH